MGETPYVQGLCEWVLSCQGFFFLFFPNLPGTGHATTEEPCWSM